MERVRRYFAEKWFLFFHTGMGKFARILLLIWCAVCTSKYVLVAGFFFCSGFFIASRTMLTHIWGWARFVGLPTPMEFVKGYNKLWHGTVKYGPITKIIKVKSPPTP
jgi:hypothetical protein